MWPSPERGRLLRQRKAFRSFARQAKQRRRVFRAGSLPGAPARRCGSLDCRHGELDCASLLGADAMFQLVVERRDSGIASFEGAILVDDCALEPSDVRAAVVELGAQGSELAAHLLELARRSTEPLLAVAQLDELRGNLLALVLDLGLELCDGFDGRS